MRRALLIGALGACAAFAVAACSGADDDPPPSAGVTTQRGNDASIDRPAAMDGGGSADSEGGTITCSIPPLGGSTIQAHVVHGSPPADTGGAVTAGTYDLTDLEIYVEQSSEEPDAGAGATTTDTARATLSITADMIALSRSASPPGGGAPIATMFAGKHHVDDVFLVAEETCPGTDVRQIPFTSAGSTLTLHAAQLRREVYTRRP
jgi:hypothetical protein